MSRQADVVLWGRRIGVLLLEEGDPVAVFQYEPEFVGSGIQLSPITMPLREAPYSFPALAFEAFKGLPGLLADSLPDKYGNALIDTWIEGKGGTPGDVSSIERLCYLGTRATGALEYEPAEGPEPSSAERIEIAELVALASEILTDRDEFVTSLKEGREEQAILEILSVGTSAGGARAKAVIALRPGSNEVRSGQVAAPPGFEHWLLKFDGVRGNRDKENLNDPEGHGRIEYAYSRMAAEAGIEMSECRLFNENGRQHFMTRRFDRPIGGGKLHMQSLGALGHYDFNQAGAHSYEQALMLIRRLGLSAGDVEQQFRRMAFNVIARNQDDHVKNIAFLMDRAGQWSLSPAFDMTFAYGSGWTAQHQMTLNGKRDGFAIDDFRECARAVSMKRGRAEAIVDEVSAAIAGWPAQAEAVGIPEADIDRIAGAHRLGLL